MYRYCVWSATKLHVPYIYMGYIVCIMYFILYSSTQRQEWEEETALTENVKKEDNYETNEKTD